ncbi:PIR protein, partial [Plasmodium sp. DRC-Itaito]
KIILKDKLEKELMDKFATLDTDIHNDAIPTCICEKSIADKVEKGCLRCGSVLGGGMMPSVCLLGGIGQVALSAWKPKALETAIAAALKANEANIATVAEAAGLKEGMRVVTYGLQTFKIDTLFSGIYDSFVNKGPYTGVTELAGQILEKYGPTCTGLNNMHAPSACEDFQLGLGIHKLIGGKIDTRGIPASDAIPNGLKGILEKAKTTADGAATIAREGATNAIKAQQTALIEGGFNSTTTSIYVSIIAIVVIVLIMIIIYLILRYRRKKKMKKKLQYIKLLEE